MSRLRPRPLVDLARALIPKATATNPSHHFGVVGSVQTSTATLSSLDGATVTLPGVAWIVPPTAGQTVLVVGFGGRMLIVGPIPYTGGGSGGGPSGVSSFNTRTGAVALTKTDVTATGLAAADVGAASPAALAAEMSRAEAAEALAAAKANNLSDLDDAATARANLGAASAISTLAGSLSADVTAIGTSGKTILTTSSLSDGVWLLEVGVSFVTATVASAACSLSVASGSATITGQSSTAAYVNANHNGAASVRALVTVTAAATVAIVAKTDTSTVDAKATNPVTSAPGASGWTAVKVA